MKLEFLIHKEEGYTMLNRLRQRWLSLLIYFMLPALMGCSKQERAIRAFRKAERLVEKGDNLKETGREKQARATYERATLCGNSILHLLPEDHPLFSKSIEMRDVTLLKSRSFIEPEAAVLLLLKFMGQGDLDGLKRVACIHLMAQQTMDPDLWEALSPRERETWVDCCEAVIGHWLNDTSEYWRAMQWTTKSMVCQGDKATVTMTWRSTLGEADILLQCVRSSRGWQIFDFVLPALHSSLSKYMTEMLSEILRQTQDFREFLNLPDRRLKSIEAFIIASVRINTMEKDLIGKRVRIEKEMDSVFEVMDQENREGQWWVLLRQEEQDHRNAEWLPMSTTKLVEEERELWGLD